VYSLNRRIATEFRIPRPANMEFLDFEQADTTYQLPDADHDSELANLFASMSPSAHEMDFFSDEIRAQGSLDGPSPDSPSPARTGTNILGISRKSRM